MSEAPASKQDTRLAGVPGGSRTVAHALKALAVVAERARSWLLQLGFEPPEPGKKRRYAYPCLDWQAPAHTRLHITGSARAVSVAYAAQGQSGHEHDAHRP